MPCVIDDDEVSIGAGAFSRTYALSALPAVDVVPWDSLAAIPTALVTGSNGKTTTTRLIAAMLATQYGLEHVALSSTDGVKVGHAYLNAGDYSGPTGARLALRDARVKAAVLETARGGILRRGLAVAKADVAVVTNVSADHFGEYGVETLDDIADAKLAVARVLGRTGTIIINADDTTLAPRLAQQVCKVACFALDDDQPLLSVARAKGHATCAVRAAHLILFHDGERHDLGRVAELPLAMGGAATYNIANMAAAALAALALDIPVDDIAAVLARFGRSNEDNPGRLERWQINGATVLMDYAHNPEGLSRLLDVATALRKPGGSLRLLLGQAGNRTDADIAELARVAAKARPIEIVLKELPGYARTRTAAEVPKLLRAALLAANLHDTTLHDIADEHQAAMALVANARAGDVIVLPVHQRSAKDAVRRELNRLTR
jgi:UDP-N-acetylmuramyl tripeptide synthase